jgi:hypothetical protein
MRTEKPLPGFVGQVGNLRPIGNRPGAAPRKLLRPSSKASFYWVPFDVNDDALELPLIAHQPVEAFVLPEWLSCARQDPIALPRSEPLQRVQHLRKRHTRRDQQMHVVRHNDETMEPVMPGVAIQDRVDHHLRDLRVAQVKGSGHCMVEKTVHCHKGAARGPGRRKHAMRRRAAVKAPGDECGLAEALIVRQAASVECGHSLECLLVGGHLRNLWGRLETCGPIGNRPSAPHKAESA